MARTVARHYFLAALAQAHKVVGSLASIGQPANLVARVGGGVKEFFYAPARGVVESPRAFAQGVVGGTLGLGGAVIGGLGAPGTAWKYKKNSRRRRFEANEPYVSSTRVEGRPRACLVREGAELSG